MLRGYPQQSYRQTHRTTVHFTLEATTRHVNPVNSRYFHGETRGDKAHAVFFFLPVLFNHTLREKPPLPLVFPHLFVNFFFFLCNCYGQLTICYNNNCCLWKINCCYTSLCCFTDTWLFRFLCHSLVRPRPLVASLLHITTSRKIVRTQLAALTHTLAPFLVACFL